MPWRPAPFFLGAPMRWRAAPIGAREAQREGPWDRGCGDPRTRGAARSSAGHGGADPQTRGAAGGSAGRSRQPGTRPADAIHCKSLLTSEEDLTQPERAPSFATSGARSDPGYVAGSTQSREPSTIGPHSTRRTQGLVLTHEPASAHPPRDVDCQSGRSTPPLATTRPDAAVAAPPGRQAESLAPRSPSLRSSPEDRRRPRPRADYRCTSPSPFISLGWGSPITCSAVGATSASTPLGRSRAPR